MKHYWNDTDRGNPSAKRNNTCLSTTLSTRKPTCICLGLNPGFYRVFSLKVDS